MCCIPAMPASDNTINQIPAEDAGLQIPATALDDEDSDEGTNNQPVVDDDDEVDDDIEVQYIGGRSYI